MTAKIAAALVAAQKSLKGVHKNARNPHHNYDYASSEAIYAECREALLAEGLVVVPWASSAVEGGTWLRREYKILHTDGDVMQAEQMWPIVPGNGRPLDKACASAFTASLGYFLRDLLLLPRVEKGVDLDDGERDDRAPPPKAPAQSTTRRDPALFAQVLRVAANKTTDAQRKTLMDRTRKAGQFSEAELDVLGAYMFGHKNLQAGDPPEKGMTPEEVINYDRAAQLLDDGNSEVAA